MATIFQFQPVKSKYWRMCPKLFWMCIFHYYFPFRIRQKQKEGGTYSPRDAEIIDTKFKLDQLITVADLELKDERFTR